MKENEVTKEDLQALGKIVPNLRLDEGEDQILNERQEEVDFSGKDLDVPGRTLPDHKGPNALKDEENQLYSQGSADNENLEQDPGPITP